MTVSINISYKDSVVPSAQTTTMYRGLFKILINLCSIVLPCKNMVLSSPQCVASKSDGLHSMLAR